MQGWVYLRSMCSETRKKSPRTSSINPALLRCTCCLPHDDERLAELRDPSFTDSVALFFTVVLGTRLSLPQLPGP